MEQVGVSEDPGSVSHPLSSVSDLRYDSLNSLQVYEQHGSQALPCRYGRCRRWVPICPVYLFKIRRGGCCNIICGSIPYRIPAFSFIINFRRERTFYCYNNKGCSADSCSQFKPVS